MMDVRAYFGKWKHIFVKYKYVILASAAGLLLLFWPFGTGGAGDTDGPGTPSAPETTDTAALEARIAALLMQADGVGRAEVMLSIASDTSLVYADERTRASEEERTGEHETSAWEESTSYLTIRREDGGETPVLLGRVGPRYLGAVVVCDGADHAGVRLKVINAVAALTGLSSDRITVMKMK